MTNAAINLPKDVCNDMVLVFFKCRKTNVFFLLKVWVVGFIYFVCNELV